MEDFYYWQHNGKEATRRISSKLSKDFQLVLNSKILLLGNHSTVNWVHAHNDEIHYQWYLHWILQEKRENKKCISVTNEYTMVIYRGQTMSGDLPKLCLDTTEVMWLLTLRVRFWICSCLLKKPLIKVDMSS